jgi:hypothetical protein
MRKTAIGLLAFAFLAAVNFCSAAPVVPYEVNLNEYGEAGYLWSGYTPQNPGTPIGWKPEVGDILFMTSPDPGQTITYALARTWHPFHIAIIARRSNGELGIFESGGGGDLRVTFRPILGRLGAYDMFAERRFTWARRIRRPLTPEQSRLITTLAEPQIDKPFVPYSRLAWFWLPGHPAPRPTRFDQDKWFCSDVIVAVLNEANVLPKGQFEPGSTTPRELFTDCPGKDISQIYHAPLPWSLNLSRPPEPGPRCAPYKAKE